jgi:hypothetical protein
MCATTWSKSSAPQASAAALMAPAEVPVMTGKGLPVPAAGPAVVGRPCAASGEQEAGGGACLCHFFGLLVYCERRRRLPPFDVELGG